MKNLSNKKHSDEVPVTTGGPATAGVDLGAFVWEGAIMEETMGVKEFKEAAFARGLSIC